VSNRLQVVAIRDNVTPVLLKSACPCILHVRIEGTRRYRTRQTHMGRHAQKHTVQASLKNGKGTGTWLPVSVSIPIAPHCQGGSGTCTAAPGQMQPLRISTADARAGRGRHPPRASPSSLLQARLGAGQGVHAAAWHMRKSSSHVLILGTGFSAHTGA
jgi:hypothetical protein